MKPPTSKSAARVIAESIRTQLDTDAVVLIMPGSPQFAVVAAQAPDAAACRADSAADSPGEPAAPARQDGEKLAYSVAEAARVLGLSHSLIYAQLRTGRLGSHKVGRRRIITREHIERFLAGP